ncbi:family 1 glycosylhydrolase [Nocardia vulneris]|uniref:Glycoside hydrolase family 1 n=1 Tax=Nocardia vulneris TaxID=1141657 RepID=A0ABR4ZNS7_9NOCA|nr:family 1 glycosylhydrolase [Nocardia vulneris]KIA66690.1 glycoside hydrolase family 1 [Nocardia vulneris]
MRTWTRRAASAVAASLVALLVPGVAVAVPPGPAAGVPALGPDFLWGVAASGFQSEGHVPNSNWTNYIDDEGLDPYGNSIDFFDRYAADIDLAKSLGVKVFRIGIEWARLQPSGPDQWDADGFAFYDKVVAKIVAAGMRPMITLDHWVYPGWAFDEGGWDSDGMVEHWLANMKKVVDRYDRRDPLWVTINEPVAYIMHEVHKNETDQRVMEDRVVEAHNAIYDYIHQKRRTAKVTSNFGYVAGEDEQANGQIIEKMRDRLDYVGVDYYFARGAAPSSVSAPARAIADAQSIGMWQLPLRTEGIYYALQRYSRLFPGKPLYVVENGMPTEDGTPRLDGYTRSDHLRDTIYWLQRAKADGMNLIGYNYWSITDNYEWGSYTPRFGLYQVDVAADPGLARKPTDAVATYTAIIGDGGVPADYQPTREPAPCHVVDWYNGCTDPGPVP